MCGWVGVLLMFLHIRFQCIYVHVCLYMCSHLRKLKVVICGNFLYLIHIASCLVWPKKKFTVQSVFGKDEGRKKIYDTTFEFIFRVLSHFWIKRLELLVERKEVEFKTFISLMFITPCRRCCKGLEGEKRRSKLLTLWIFPKKESLCVGVGQRKLSFVWKMKE